MNASARLSRIPPYLFAELERKIADKRAAGIDVISLGIGDPDRPTPALIVEAAQEALTDHLLALTVNQINSRTLFGVVPISDAEIDQVITGGVAAFARAYRPA